MLIFLNDVSVSMLRAGYWRPDLSAAAARSDDLARRLNERISGELAEELLLEWDELRAQLFAPRSWSWLAHHGNLLDEAAQLEQQFWAAHESAIERIDSQFWRALTSYEDGLTHRFGPQLFRIARCAAQTCVPRDPQFRSGTVEQLAVAAGELQRLCCVPSFEINGDWFSVQGVRKLFQHTERDVRRSAWQAREAFCADNAHTLSRLGEHTSRLRQRRAEELGFDDFLAVAYREQRRIGYGAVEIAAFRREVQAHIVPLCHEEFERRAQRLGFDGLMVFDEGLAHVSEAPVPLGDLPWMVSTMTSVCEELHPTVHDAMQSMVRNEMLDLEPRPGKTQAGSCMFIADQRHPFVIASYDGYGRDVGTVVHELGHAFHQYAARNQPFLDYAVATAEVSEMCANGMTILTLPWLERFFGETAQVATRDTVFSMVASMPLVCLIDHFEHELFVNPTMTHAQRCELWRGLERQYMPWRRYPQSMPNLDAGATSYLYPQLPPLYSIGYALAAAGALQLLERASLDRVAATNAYVAMCESGGSIPFDEVLQLGGLVSPFQASALGRTMVAVRRVLEEDVS